MRQADFAMTHSMHLLLAICSSLQPYLAREGLRRSRIAPGGIHCAGRTKSSQGGLLAQAGGPAALFCLVRPERASVRFSLSTQRALSAILQGFGELGWPEVTEEMSFAR